MEPVARVTQDGELVAEVYKGYVTQMFTGIERFDIERLDGGGGRE